MKTKKAIKQATQKPLDGVLVNNAVENHGGPAVSPETRSQGTNGNKRAQIVDKAVELFNRFGYGSVKISDITDAVRIGKGTLYLYFKNKRELLLECFRRLESLIFTLEQSDGVRTAEGFFGRMPHRLAGVVDQYNKFAVINNLIKASVGSDVPEISKRAKQSYRTIIEPLKRDLEIAIQNGDARSTDAELAVYGLIGFADGVNFRVALDNRYRPQQVVDFLLDFVDHAFRSTTTQPSVAGDLSAIITDQNGVCTEVEQVCCLRENKLKGSLGLADVEVDLRRIASIVIREAAPNWFADVGMIDGGKASIQIEPDLELSAESPIGKLRIALRSVSTVVFHTPRAVSS